MLEVAIIEGADLFALEWLPSYEASGMFIEIRIRGNVTFEPDTVILRHTQVKGAGR
jgi:hypothetical protein